MSRSLRFLMLATGVVLAGSHPNAEQAAPGAAAAQVKTETPQSKAEAGQPKTDDAAEPAAGAQAPKDGEGKVTSTPGSKALGMSILGNQEAPTSLVIVPWKSSELGASLGLAPMLDDSRQPIDRDVFMRALRYYEISSGTTGHDGAKAGGRDNATARSDAAQSTAAPRR